ncbi:MAG: DUF488 domain-containing protein [Bacteroidetes bacterium]|nr:DUF488 domain-containing protein [Bacteroidota bacterium]MBS1931593.1 DUF488 domain-containing protein [Bacteroidota bacterium]
MNHIQIKRIYESPSEEDGYRILVDRLWPRGIKKEKAKLDEWLKDLGPSDTLRKWFNHQPERFKEFEKKYLAELTVLKDELKRIKILSKKSTITLLYSARNTEMNQAVVILKVLNRMK